MEALLFPLIRCALTNQIAASLSKGPLGYEDEPPEVGAKK